MPAQTELVLQTVVKGTETATKALNDVKGSLDKVGDSAKTVGSKFSSLKKGFEDSVDASKKLGVALLGIGTGGAIAFTKLSNSFTEMQNTLRQVSKTEEDLNKNQRKMLDLANEARVPIEDLTKSFVRFDKVNTQMGGSQNQTAQMLSNLSKGLSLSGATAEEAGSAMLQLSQAFGSGKLQGDEFRSLAESMPMLLDIIAKSMNVPRGKLKDLASEGKITSKVLKDALLGATNEIESAFAKSQVSIASSLTVFKNNILVTFGELDKQYGVTQKVVGAIGQLSDAFMKAVPSLILFGEWFVQNKEVIVGVIVGGLTPAIIGLGIAIGGVMGRLAPFMLIGGLIANNWEPIVETFNKVKETITQSISTVISYYKNWKRDNEDIVKSISDTFNKVKVIFTLVFDIIKTIISNDLAIIKMIWVKWGEDIKYVLSTAFDVVKNIVVATLKTLGIIFQGGLDILTGVLKVFKGIFTGDFSLMWEGIKQVFVSSWNTIKELFLFWFGEMAKSAKEWAGNMIQMFVDGLKEKVEALKAGIEQIATTISDYLGFHSPTKKGPGKDADKWMPNLITMLSQGLSTGTAIIDTRAKEIATKLSSIGKKFSISDISTTLTSLSDKASSAFQKVTSSIESSASKIKSLKSDISDITKTINELQGNKGTVETEGKARVGERAVEIEKELAELKRQTSADMSSEDIIKMNSLQNELTYAKSIITQEEYQLAVIQSQKSETQKILDNMVLKQAEIDIEIQKNKELLAEKQNNLRAEEESYKELAKTRVNLENQYYDLFKKNIQGVQQGIQDTISLMMTLNRLRGGSVTSTTLLSGARATGGPVGGGKTYLVGENGPELFTPGTSGQIIPNNRISGGGGSIVINISGMFGSDAVGEISDAIVTNLKRASYI